MKTKIIGVLGLGIFGQTLAQELSNFEQDVIAIDSNPENVQAVAEVVTKAAIGDITDLAFLKHIGISDCDTVIIATGNSLESSVLAVMHCKKASHKLLLKLETLYTKKYFMKLVLIWLSLRSENLGKMLLQTS